MRPRQFSIAGSLVVIGILGVTFGALRNPSYLWANTTFSLAFAALVIAVLNTILGQGARRAYWLGFALCGWAYFAVCAVPGLRDSLCPRLVSEPILDFVYPLVFPTPVATSPTTAIASGSNVWIDQAGQIYTGFPAQAAAASAEPTLGNRWAAWTQYDSSLGFGYRIGTVSLVSSEAFRQIGHAMTTLLVAALGGLYARGRYKAWAKERPPAPAG